MKKKKERKPGDLYLVVHRSKQWEHCFKVGELIELISSHYSNMPYFRGEHECQFVKMRDLVKIGEI